MTSFSSETPQIENPAPLISDGVEPEAQLKALLEETRKEANAFKESHCNGPVAVVFGFNDMYDALMSNPFDPRWFVQQSVNALIGIRTQVSPTHPLVVKIEQLVDFINQHNVR